MIQDFNYHRFGAIQLHYLTIIRQDRSQQIPEAMDAQQKALWLAQLRQMKEALATLSANSDDEKNGDHDLLDPGDDDFSSDSSVDDIFDVYEDVEYESESDDGPGNGIPLQLPEGVFDQSWLSAQAEMHTAKTGSAMDTSHLISNLI